MAKWNQVLTSNQLAMHAKQSSPISHATLGTRMGASALCSQANARSYSGRMLWEQIRTVLPIFAFLIGYKVRVC